MLNYFAHGNKFRPHSKETGLPILDTITGVLEYFDFRSGNSASGRWFVLRITNDKDSYNAFFDSQYIGSDDIGLLESLQSRVIRLGCQRGIPVINVINVNSEGDLRAELLTGVATGTIKMEDLPALLEFAKGNDALYEKWQLFKKRIDNEGADKVREEINKDIEEIQAAIERRSTQRDNLYCIYEEVMQEKGKMLEELNSVLIFLQGEESLHGTKVETYGNHSDNLVPIHGGYRKLMEALEKFKTKKELLVVCGNTLHMIHHVYLDESGRAFLLGSSKEFLRTKPEKVKGMIDKILSIRYDGQTI